MRGKGLFIMVAVALFIAGITGCSKESPVQTGPVEKTLTTTQGAGGFGMSYLKGLAKTRNASKVQSGGNVNFNLGSIKGSTAFYFLLYNVGNSLITNVTLTMSDTMFSVYPAAMDTLVPGTDLGMLPVIKVSAFHGTSLDGVGSRSIMKQGANGATLHIQGTTKTAGGADTVVTLSAGLQLQALVMDFSFYGLGGEVNLSAPKTSSMGRFLPDSGMSVSMPSTWMAYYPCNFKFNTDFSKTCYRDDARDTLIKILNTGNVPVVVTEYLATSTPVVKASVAPGDSLVIPNAQGRYVIDGNHTTADPKRMNLHTDGQFYFEFDVPVRPTCGTYFDWDAFKLFPSRDCNGTQTSLQRLDSDSTLMYWTRKGTCADTTSEYTLFLMSPDSIVAQYKETVNGPVEQYVNQTYKDLLTQLREASE
jgi:hypothetical protein